MGERTAIKYSTLAMVFLSLASTFFSAFRKAKSEGSPGGEEITQAEWFEIGMDVEKKLGEALPGVKAFVFFVAEE